MIDKLRSLAIFATVIDQQTFRAAAKHLGLAPSRVSKIVSDLESELGVTLLHRSTRQLSLTTEGQILYAKISQMLQAAQTGLDSINNLSTQPAGELRVTAPAFITQTGLMDSLSEFSHTYPNVSLRLNFSDHQRQLIKDGFDVGIRAGWLEDSDLLSRKIGQIDRLLVASSDYVASKPPASHPKDLEKWDWVRFSMRPDRTEFISKAGEKTSVVQKFRIEVDSAYALFEFAVRDQGLTQLPEYLALRGIEKGELVHVTPEWSLRPLDIVAVWPDRSRRESLAQLFVRFMADKSDRI